MPSPFARLVARCAAAVSATRLPIAAYGVLLGIAAVQASIGVRPAPTLMAALAYVGGLLTVLALAWLGPVVVDGRVVRRVTEALAVVGGLLGIWLAVRFLSALPDGIGVPSGFYRVKAAVTSPIGDHNTAAGLLLVGIVAAVIVASSHRRGWVLVVATGIGLVATLSRGAVVILVVAAAVSWWLAANRRVAGTLTGIAAFATAAVLGLARLLDASPPPGAAVPTGPVGTSVVGRLDLAVRGFEVLGERPILGVGFGQFGVYARDLPSPNDHAHQLFAHAGAEGGVLALVAVTVLCTALVARAWRLPRSSLRDLALLGGGALLLHAQVDVLGGLPTYELLVAVLLGLVTSVQLVPSQGRTLRRDAPRRRAGRQDPRTG